MTKILLKRTKNRKSSIHPLRHDITLLKFSLLLMDRICFNRSKFFPLILRREAKIKVAEMLPLKVYPFSLNRRIKILLIPYEHHIGVGRFRILGGPRFRIWGGARGGGANSQQANDVVTTSMRRKDVASTSFRRRVPIRFLINQCQIITFLILKYDFIENSRIELRGIVLPVQMGGLLGGPKGMLPPPPPPPLKLLGGPGPPGPPLPTPMHQSNINPHFKIMLLSVSIFSQDKNRGTRSMISYKKNMLTGSRF